MPWISEAICTGCRLCIRECPVSAIELNADGFAVIDEAECIRCGRCHDVCPQGAVRHDGERIGLEVTKNLQWVRDLLRHYSEPEDRSAFMQRMVRFFNKQTKVSQRTAAAITAAQANGAEGIKTAIRELSQNPANE